jgi:NAD(P)-dependent dehydrogenase (short-subunit alcohol dehydrogenase family)
MWSHNYSDWEDTFRINTTAHYFLAVALMKHLAKAATSKFDDEQRLGREVGCGVVIITSSCASGHNSTNVDLSSYATSKAATDHLVRLLASKFTRWGVRVNSINPGCKSKYLRWSSC